MTIPGVGAVSALALVAVMGDIRRFRRPGNLVSYLGLDPKVRQSSEREAWTGHISRAGQAHALGLLVEAAHAARLRQGAPLLGDRGFAQVVYSPGVPLTHCQDWEVR